MQSGIAIWTCVLALAACGPRSVAVSGRGTGKLKFSQCPPHLGGKGVECARVHVPLRWQSSAGDATTVLLRRVRARGGKPPQGQVWALDGGPGFSGDAFLSASFVALIRNAGFDLYVPSHRGTRDDSTLRCPTQSAPGSVGGGRIEIEEWRACRAYLEMTWGEGLAEFSSSAAAADVDHLMSRVPNHGRRLVYAGSYGSLWAQRLLQQRPTGLDGVWLDSIVSFDASLERTDENGNAAMARLLQWCAEIPACRRQFSDEPISVARSVVAAYGSGQGCGQVDKTLERDGLQRLMNRYLHGPPAFWKLAVQAWTRAHRCNAGDKDWLQAQVKQRVPRQRPSSKGVPLAGYSVVLNRVILYRELYRFDVEPGERLGVQPTLLASGGVDESVAKESRAFGASWRRPGSARIPNTRVPIVLLSGGLDPLDPPEWARKTASLWPSSTLVFVRWAGHSVLRYLGLGPGSCGAKLLTQFLRGESIDPSCARGKQGHPWGQP